MECFFEGLSQTSSRTSLCGHKSTSLYEHIHRLKSPITTVKNKSESHNKLAVLQMTTFLLNKVVATPRSICTSILFGQGRNKTTQMRQISSVSKPWSMMQRSISMEGFHRREVMNALRKVRTRGMRDFVVAMDRVLVIYNLS